LSSQLNQWAMDFEGNAERIIKSIQIAKSRGATFRTGPELEITYLSYNLSSYVGCRGYGCLDHFLENDTYIHSWEMLCRIISHPDCQGILLDIGMYSAPPRPPRCFCFYPSLPVSAGIMCLRLRPVRHHSVYYNCRVIVYNKHIHLIRPKIWLANDGNYRERRYFQGWRQERYWEMHDIPQSVWPLLDSGQVRISKAQTPEC